MKLIPTIDPIPYLRIENFFNKVELEQLVFPELDYFTKAGKLLPASETGAARDNDGKVVKNNSGLFCESTYRDSSSSSTATIINKLWNTNTCDAIEKTGPWNRGFRQCTASATLFSYYQEGDYYLPHLDQVQFTLLIWLWKEPKAWTGGEFMFNDASHTVPMKNNSAVLFPSCYSHSVNRVAMNTPSHMDGTGRYCISRFYWIHQSTEQFSYNGHHPQDMTPVNLSDSFNV
jgi:hypothetical protein